MAAHFPGGHEIVRPRRWRRAARTLTVEGTNTAEVAPALAGVMPTAVKVGRTARSRRADTVKIKECRIIYRRAGSTGPPPDFATIATLAPAEYLDPNDAAPIIRSPNPSPRSRTARPRTRRRETRSVAGTPEGPAGGIPPDVRDARALRAGESLVSSRDRGHEPRRPARSPEPAHPRGEDHGRLVA